MKSAAALSLDRTGPQDAGEYLGLLPDQRYDVVSQRFPEWLKKEPVEFPPHHRAFGWSCLVDGCSASMAPTLRILLCFNHIDEYNRIKGEVSLEDFRRTAKPSRAQNLGHCLERRSPCIVCGDQREAQTEGYCPAHWDSWRRAKRAGLDHASWAKAKTALPPWPERCAVQPCVHDADLLARAGGLEHRVCRLHWKHWRLWLSKHDDTHPSWVAWLTHPVTQATITHTDARGLLHLAELSTRLQREFRYALHQHAKVASRSHWRPAHLQRVVSILLEEGIETLSDPRVPLIADDRRLRGGRIERRILLSLPVAARGLAVTGAMAREAGWFDPIIVGAAQFPGVQGEKNRRKVWDLTDTSQPWLRNLLWDYMRDEALSPAGRRAGAGLIRNRIRGVGLLSHLLRQIRTDNGEDPRLLDSADANAVKDIWDLWFQERIPIPSSGAQSDNETILTEILRHTYMSNARVVLLHSRAKGRTPPALDSFILSLPEYSRPPKSPRPRPLTYDNFQLLVAPDSIRNLEAADRENIGLADIWLTQAFQGGRISETLSLRLGCIGLVGNTQPYIWRDISKVNVIDYGMPCYLPVYERLLRRQEITRAKLRVRYSDTLAQLKPTDRAALEAKWEREMPLFPRTNLNDDLVLEVTRTVFGRMWSSWFESLGLKGITTHQTRATLATSLLNNGAPAALVRQLLGHFSNESLAHYATYNNDTMSRHLQQVWAAGPGMDKPGTILLRPRDVNSDDSHAAATRIDLTVVPVEHGLCRYGPVVGGAHCPYGKNCTNGLNGPCEHFVLTGADLAYWERKRDAAYHFAEGAPNDSARDYILQQWHPWEPVLASLREALADLGLLEEAEQLDLRTPVHDYFDPLFSAGWSMKHLDGAPNRELPGTP